MHYHGEVYFKERPKDVLKAVSKAMEPYREWFNEETDEYGGFWDWFVIGGRWSGEHTKMKLDQEKLRDFYKVCEEKGLFWIGGEYSEEVQKVRRCEEFLRIFPDFKGLIPTCRDVYKEDGYADDIVPVEEVTPQLRCYTLILPGEVLHYKVWDGKAFRKTGFDGCVKKALDARGITTGYLVTVDYHR